MADSGVALGGLVCPACRRVQDGALIQHDLQPVPAGLGCPGCGRVHPVVDGIPVVLRDLDTWLQTEAVALVRRTDLPPAVDARIARGAGGTLWRDHQRRQVAQQSPDGPLHAWLRQTLAGLSGDILELGCGRARHGDDRVIGLDLHWDSLRDHPGPALVADALDPPFRGGRFDVVVAVNLLDSCRDPGLLLQQLEALLAPGGSMVLASPFHWQAEVTPPALWLSPETVESWLRSRGFQLHREHAAWTLRTGPRTRIEHDCLTWVARREATT